MAASSRRRAAAGDGAASRKLAAKALKAGATGADRDEPKRLAAGQPARRK